MSIVRTDRSYRGPQSVASEYDAWTQDRVLERHWGEHIHHGFYPRGGWWGTDFRKAKVELIDELLSKAGLQAPPKQILDVGCGIGGSTRELARRFQAPVSGVTLSPAQVDRAQELTPPSVPADFRVANALDLPFKEGQFDLVWSCESGEHMPNKQAFFGEMVRVLAPGGTLILATWCHRASPLTSREQQRLSRIYEAWALPFFVPLETYAGLAEDHGLSFVLTEDWSRYTAPTWSHQIALGLWDLPWLVRQGTSVIRRSLEDAWAVKDMIRGFARGTIVYGVLTGRKPT